MGPMSGKSAYNILLILTCAGLGACAAREAARAPTKTGAAAGAPPSDVAPVSNPQAVMSTRRSGPLDPRRVRDDFGLSRALSPAAAEQQARDQRAPKVVAELRAAKLADTPVVVTEALSDDALDPTNTVEAASVPEDEPAPVTPVFDDALAKRPASRVRSTAKLPAEENLLKSLPAEIELDSETLVAHRVEHRGALWITDAQGGLQPMPARAMRVVSHIQGARVRTLIDYVFENPSDQRLEGTFHIELPQDAVPAGFTVFDGTIRVQGDDFFDRQRILPNIGSGFVTPEASDQLAPTQGPGTIDWQSRSVARVVPATEARRAQSREVAQRNSASTLQWGGGQSFRAQVYPIEAHSLKRVVIAYEAPLSLVTGHATYLPVAPPPGNLQWQASTFVDERHGAIVNRPAQTKISKAGGWTRIDMSLATRGRIEVEVSAEQAVLRSEIGFGLAGDVFWGRVEPQIPQSSNPAPTGRAIFMVDSSASETPEKAARRASLLQALLQNDESISEYAVMLFDVRARWLHRLAYRRNTPRARAQTLAELRKVYFEGATNVGAAIGELEHQRSWLLSGQRPTVFLLSDAAITWGPESSDQILAQNPVLQEVRLMAYRFDAEASHGELLSRLSQAGGGRVISVSAGTEVKAASQAHRFAGAKVVSVEVVGAPCEDFVVQGNPQYLFPGQVLNVAGRLPMKGQGRLRIVYEWAGSPKAVEISLGNEASADLLAARAWADLFAARLQSYADPRLDGLLVALGQRFNLANRKASFVVLPAKVGPGDYDFDAQSKALDELRTQIRRDRAASLRAAQGLGTEGLSAEVRSLLTVLRQRSDGPAKGAPLLFAPHAGGSARARAEREYRQARSHRPGDFRVFDRIARTRATYGDTAGALRALSTAVERSGVDASAMSTVGYALMALGQYPAASEIFARLRRQRPFEGQGMLQEALALEAAGSVGAAALRYERIFLSDYKGQTERIHRAAALAYAQLLFEVDGVEAKLRRVALRTRFPIVGLEAADLRATAYWSVGASDVDVWVYEPDGRRCSSAQPKLSGGGRLLENVVNGLGPETYQVLDAAPGAYDVLVHYRRGPADKVSAPAGVLMVLDRRQAQGMQRRFMMRLLPEPGAVLMLRTERF